MTDRIDNIKAVKALELVKAILASMGHHNWSIIPESKTRLMTAPGDVRLHIEIVEYNNQFILKIEEILVEDAGNGIGSFILYAITKACELHKCKCGLWVRRGNKDVLNWYKNNGFKKCNRKNLQNDIWLEKTYTKQTNYLENKLGEEAVNVVNKFYDIYEKAKQAKNLMGE